MLGIIPGVNPNGPPGTAGRPVQRGVNVITADNVNRILRFNGNTSAGRLAARHGAAGTEDRVVGLRSTGARETVAQTLAARMSVARWKGPPERWFCQQHGTTRRGFHALGRVAAVLAA